MFFIPKVKNFLPPTTKTTTAIILDPSVPGNENGNTSTQEDATWTTTFPYGTISGIASCNNIEGTWGVAHPQYNDQITQGYQDGAVHCWCRMTSPARSAGVAGFSDGTASYCATQCANYCGRSIRDNTYFRTAMYGSAGN